VWQLGCAGAANDVSSGPSTSGKGGAGMAGRDGAGVPSAKVGSGGSAAGSGGVLRDGASGAVGAGTGGAVIGEHDAGTDGMAHGGPEAGMSGSAPGTGGAAGSMEPLAYPTLDGDMIGAPVMVATGFTLAESPLWDHCGHQLLFADVQGGAFARGAIHTLSEAGDLGVLVDGTTNTNGIAFDIDGSLIMAVMGGGGHLARRDKAGVITNIEPPGGPNLHTPDDVTVRSDGTIYFTDGNFYPIGSLLGANSQLPVFILAPGGSALETGGVVGGPNGIELAPDEKTLYVSAYGEGSVIEFDVADDGSLTEGAVLISGLTRNDSMCVDAAGNVYVGVSTGIQVVRPDGAEVALIPIPSATTSCNFGGDDGKTLYITSWTTLFEVEGMPIPGQDWVANKARIDCD